MARSLGEFWQRWHVSLTTWFRDYVFVPLGRRSRGPRLFFSLMLTFFLAGLWHGPNWTYVLWAIYFGLCFAAAHGLRKLRRRVVGRIPRSLEPVVSLIKFVGVFAVFSLGEVFFRSQTVTEAFQILGELLNPFFWQRTMHLWPPATLDGHSLWIAGIALAISVPFEALLAYKQLDKRLDKGPAWIRWAMYYALVLSILLFGEFGARPFFYFQF
jgi:alginate O-acetyltransferase complex protein AlgI